MALTARAISQSHVITVSPDDPLLSVHRLFIEEQISGAPVVGETGKLLGVVSSADLLRSVVEERDGGRSQLSHYSDLLEFAGSDWLGLPEDFKNRLDDSVVSEVMTDSVVSVSPETPVPEVARTETAFRTSSVATIAIRLALPSAETVRTSSSPAGTSPLRPFPSLTRAKVPRLRWPSRLSSSAHSISR